MEPLDNQAMGSEDLTSEAKSALFATRPWMLFIAILGFIYAGLLVIGSLANITSGSAAAGIFLLLIGLFIGYIFFLLFRSAQNINRFKNGSNAAFEAAIKDYKTYWMIWGILIIIFIALMVFSIISTLFIGGAAF